MTDTKYSKSLQLLLYAYLFQNDNIKINNIESGIISLKNISEGLMKVEVPDEKQINKNTLDIFESHLKNLIFEIFNKENTFKQTENIDNCKYCIYKGICNQP